MHNAYVSGQPPGSAPTRANCARPRLQSLVMYDPDSGYIVAILLNGTGEDQNLPARLFTALLAAGEDQAVQQARDAGGAECTRMAP